MSELTEQEKQHIIDEVNATMAMSDMPLTEEDKQMLKAILDGNITVDKAIQDMTEKYKE